MGVIIFFRKPNFWQILVKLINLNGFELIWLDRMLNWPLHIIFRLGSKPTCLQTHRNLFENAQNHPPQKTQNVNISQNRCFVQNGFFKSRPHMAAQADPQSGKCSYIDSLSFILSSKTGLSRPKNDLLPQVFNLDPRFSWKSTFSFGAFFDLFFEGHRAFCGGFDIILK